ncbi:MAG: hypothetical protein KKE16_00420 [Firmicutes bacterium]|nr:hypothetical protein [Bacillota bacterium]
MSTRTKVIVNGNPVPLKITFMTGFAGLDQEIELGEKKAHFVLINGKPDLAFDGFFLDSKKEYVPLQGVPKWVWLFVVACIGIPVYTLGGAVPALLGFGGITICVKISIIQKFNTMVKVLLCTAVTATAWIVAYLFIQWALSVL